MNEENPEITDQEVINENQKKSRNPMPIIVTVLIAAWLIGMSILGAGWLISKEIAKQTVKGTGAGDTTAPVNTPVDIQLNDNIPQEGSGDAKVTVIEFADFQCPFCGEWQQTIYPDLKSNYIDTGKVKFAFWNFAFLGDESTRAAEAAMCAKDQNKFWDFHDYLYSHQDGENQGTFSDANLKKFAGDVGLDKVEFNKCFDSGNYKTVVSDAVTAASKYGVNSTPTIFVNGLKFEGVMPFSNLKQIIDSELAK